MKNYYEELEVSRNASNEIISRAYKVLAKKYHPDTTTENKQLAEERFKKISEAYEVLSNEQKRAEYDKTLGPQIDSDRYNKMLEDNKKLSRELLNLKSQLDNINANRVNINTPPRPNINQNVNYTYSNPNQNANYNQNNYTYNTRPTYRKKYSFLDALKYKFDELLKKIISIILTIVVILVAFGVLYLIPPTRNFLMNDLHLGFLFEIFR